MQPVSRLHRIVPGRIVNRGINFLNGTVWPTIAPRLEHLTNNGFITGVNAIYFGGKRASPYTLQILTNLTLISSTRVG